MRLQVKARNVDVSPALKEYAQKRLGKLEKHLNESARVELELQAERNPSIAQSQVAEATIWTKGPILRARESSPDMKASIDALVDKLERQVQRYRAKRSRRETARRAANGSPPPEPQFSAEQLEQMIVKSKQFDLQPLTPDEAALQLELIGHDFFVFTNVDTGKTNVVYRRRAGDYGLIEPQD